MGGGRGGGYAKSLNENLEQLLAVFSDFKDGYFGKPKPKKENIRRIYCDDPKATSEKFFELIGHNGKPEKLKNGTGDRMVMKDGSFVQLRPNSTSGGPAIDISSRRPGLEDQKIHFVSKKEESDSK